MLSTSVKKNESGMYEKNLKKNKKKSSDILRLYSNSKK